jgi:metal-responsive CopG/Arc/MetJ family transcriptional regulator
MKTKATITLEDTVLDAVDKTAGKRGRSRVIETAIVYYLKEQRSRQRGLRDREIIDRHADWLNKEMEDILSYQVEP